MGTMSRGSITPRCRGRRAMLGRKWACTIQRYIMTRQRYYQIFFFFFSFTPSQSRLHFPTIPPHFTFRRCKSMPKGPKMRIHSTCQDKSTDKPKK
ncbi:hypothetical protein K469DRAFT_244780 [Zopfia rhizophila CBS 207.26]|uniref:Uncharacterized protein n=1 Tax=Zopfia rhizophila CBS 207.26 TaxID=1314779 RepID=A0A6A6ESU1_9PEZI|nr:hypothetical protein K469DRAFT_244780 [Zopfia rhizophila CBS 207.26]